MFYYKGSSLISWSHKLKKKQPKNKKLGTVYTQDSKNKRLQSSLITELKPTYTMVVITYIPESKRNLSTPDYEQTVYVKSHEKSPTVYSLSMTELCLSLVIIPKIKKKEHYKNTNIFGTVDEGCCV